MKTIRPHSIIPHISFLVLVSVLLCLSACKDPTGGSSTTEVSQLVSVGIKVNVSDPETIERKGNPETNELDPNSLFVFVFDGEGDQARLLQFTKASPIGGNTFVALLHSSSQARKIYIVGNALETINAQSSTFDTATSTYASISRVLSTAPLLNNNLYIHEQPQVFPLIYESPMMPITLNMNIGTVDTPAEMLRNGSKVTVINETSSSQGFVIHAASIAYAPLFSYVLPPKSSLSYPMLKRTYMNPNTAHLCMVGMSTPTETQALYLYESGIENPQPSGVIVYASYQGRAGYYRLENAKGINNQELCAFERNKHYIFRIKAVENHGYPSLEEACQNLGSNVRFEIDVIDRCSHEIISNHQYYLGLSNSEFYLFGNGGFNNIEVARIAHNAPKEVFKGELAVLGTHFSIAHNPFSDINDGSINDSLPIRLNFNPQFQQGDLRIRIGNLYYNIGLTRMPEADEDETIIQTFASSDYYQAFIEGAPNWVRLKIEAHDDFQWGSSSLFNLTDGFYIHCLENPSVQDRSCVVVVNRQDGRRIRALIVQKGD